MKKLISKLTVMAGIIVGLTLLLCFSALASEDITGTLEISPKTLTSPGNVNVSINVINVSDSGSTISVTLLDPNGKTVSGFGSGGTANLEVGSSKSYSGTWAVTSAQLDTGRITYSIRYTTTDENGTKVPATRPITASISKSDAKAVLNIKRVVDPGGNVAPGQTVTIKYTIKNVGTVDVKDITIKDPEIISEPVVVAALAVDQTEVVSYSFEADATTRTSHAEVTYQYDMAGKTETSKPIMADPSVVFETVLADLSVVISADRIVNSGAKVDLKYTITNKSNLSYEKLKITDIILNDIDSNLSVKAGETKEWTKTITVNATGTYQFTVTGVDSTGKEVTIQSNQLTIQTTDDLDGELPAADGSPLDMTLVVEGDRDVIYSKPAEVIFRIKLTNNGDSPVENVVVEAAGKAVKEIERIEAGETVDFIKAFNASMEGQFQFTAEQKGNTDEENVVKSNIFQIQYVAPAPTEAPTPPPTPEPVATEDPLLAQQEQQQFTQPERSGTSVGSIAMYIIGGLVALIVVGVGVLFLLERIRNNGGGGQSGRGGKSSDRVIDTFQRSTHRDYTRAPKKNGNAAKRDIPKAVPDEESITPLRTTGSVGKQDSARRNSPDLDATFAEEEFQPIRLDDERDPLAAYDDFPEEPVIEPYREEDSSFSSARPYQREEPVTEEEIIRPSFARPASYQAPELDPEPFAPRSSFTPRSSYEPPAEESVHTPPERAYTPGQEPELEPKEQPAMEPIEDTTVFQRSYLSRIRNAPDSNKDDDLFAGDGSLPTKPSVSEEEAAMLSGSTGQYRLSRRSASVRGNDRPRPQRENPAAVPPPDFSRTQRVQRPKKADLSSFYDDDDEPTPPKRKRK